MTNGKIYVGSTSALGFKKRWWGHRTRLRANTHWNQHLQNSWNKHGEQQFRFEIIEECLPNDCIPREQYYFDTLHPQYNILQTAGSMFGYRHTTATKQKIGDACRGEKHPQYAGKHIFYHPEDGYFNGGLTELCTKFKIRENTGYRLRSGELDKSHGWIYIGNDKTPLPENIDEFYYSRIHNDRTIYSFFHKIHGRFQGVIPDFMKKYNISFQNQSIIRKLIDGKRKMAWGWIFLGEGIQYITSDIETKYMTALKQNTKANNHMDIIYEFFNFKTTENFRGTLRELIRNYNLNDKCAREMLSQRKPHLKGWTIKS